MDNQIIILIIAGILGLIGIVVAVYPKKKSQIKNDNVIELNEVITEQNKESHPNDQFKGFIASINNLKSLLNETLLSLNTPKKDKEWKEIGFKLNEAWLHSKFLWKHMQNNVMELKSINNKKIENYMQESIDSMNQYIDITCNEYLKVKDDQEIKTVQYLMEDYIEELDYLNSMLISENK